VGQSNCGERYPRRVHLCLGTIDMLLFISNTTCYWFRPRRLWPGFSEFVPVGINREVLKLWPAAKICTYIPFRLQAVLSRLSFLSHRPEPCYGSLVTFTHSATYSSDEATGAIKTKCRIHATALEETWLHASTL
jgi:hypothetical protein